jgi:hypothetical protein
LTSIRLFVLVRGKGASGGLISTAPDSICCVTEDGYPFSNTDFNKPLIRGKTFSLIAIDTRGPQTVKPILLVRQNRLNQLGWHGNDRPVSALMAK